MSRFHEYFGHYCKTEKTEIDDGIFELRLLKNEDDRYYCERQLCFINKTTGEGTVLSDNIRRFMPLGEFGIACSTFYPQGDRKLFLFFRKNGEFIIEPGYITDKKHLYYVYEGELHCCYERLLDEVVISREKFEKMGYRDEVYFDEDHFWFPSNKRELIPKIYYNYEGQELYELKRQKIFKSIMLQINIHIAENFTHQIKDAEKSKKMSELVWEATSANISDVHMLIELEKSENNLLQENADKVLAVTNCFLVKEIPHLFPRYMEFFFAADMQLSRFKERMENQLSPSQTYTKEFDDFYIEMSSKIHKNMVLITKRLTARSDFYELLVHYPKFETAVSELLEEL